ncbi:MAG: DNA primase [Burkholderiales bacterium]
MSADALLSRLDKVRQTGAGRWLARCPSHEDKTPSLSLREIDDGRVLVHCFAGCDVESVLAAVGLDFDALFPEKPIEHAKRERRPFNAGDILACIGFEALVVSVAASALALGEPLTEVDRKRLLVAAARLEHAAEVARGERH